MNWSMALRTLAAAATETSAAQSSDRGARGPAPSLSSAAAGLAGLLLAAPVWAAPYSTATPARYPVAPAAAARHVVVVSIDGLMPAAYTAPDSLGVRVPNLRRLAARGAFARGVVGVLPSVTYPSHTTIVTGEPPARHGITANTVFDPEGLSNDSWYWYAREIRVPTLVDAARSVRRTVGSVSWPASVGSPADYLVAEYWRPQSSHPADGHLLRALSTPGIFEAAENARGGRPIVSPLRDVDRMDLALAILRASRPGLLLLHLLEVDFAAHADGPDSAAARTALEAADAELGRLLEAIEALGMGDSTLVAVVSDHGFVAVDRLVRPNTLLVADGLAELDENGNARTWKAWFLSHGGSAALYLADPGDRATAQRVRALLAAKAAEPGSGIREIIEGERLRALGGDPAAEFFLDAEDGVAFSRTATGGWSGVPKTDKGYHGHAPDRPALHASLILAAPDLRRRGDLGVVPMTAIARTLAEYLGASLPPEAGAALPVF